MAINALWQGTNVKKDVPRARLLARQTCGRGSAASCFLLQIMGTDDDKAFEKTQLRSLCLAGDVDGCHYALSSDFKSPEAQPLLSEMQQLCVEKKGNACFYIKTYREQGNIP